MGEQPLTRAGLRGLVEGAEELVVVGQAASAEEAGRLAEEWRPNVALGLFDAGSGGGTALAEALQAHGTPVVLLTSGPPRGMAAALRAGVRGVLLLDSGAGQVAAALRAVSQGLLVLDPALGQVLAAGGPEVEMGDTPVEPLTQREREVLELLALGLANKGIARRLAISEHTVKFHVGSILAKLGAESRTEAVSVAARRGLLAL